MNGHAPVQPNGEAESTPSGPPNLKKLIYDQLAENLDMQEAKDNSGLFDVGLYSLQVTELATAAYIIKWCPGKELLEPKTVYGRQSVR